MGAPFPKLQSAMREHEAELIICAMAIEECQVLEGNRRRSAKGSSLAYGRTENTVFQALMNLESLHYCEKMSFVARPAPRVASNKLP